jgi:sulfite reductase (NADPH) hemoprotein beta-component
LPSHDHSRASTLGRADLRFSDQADIDSFVSMLDKFERGEISPDEWRGFRLLRGTYGQRQEGDLSMLRVKVPQGILSADAARAIADTCERWSRGFCHLTTRQNVQMHFVPLKDVAPALRRLVEAGLTTREACGNSVRNITCAPTAGVAADEPFDATPYSQALTRYLLRHPLSSSLPRKFKIAFAGGGSDHAFALVNDIGFWPHLDGGRRAFRVTVGGGTATLCRNGAALIESLPAAEMFAVAEAIVRVFHAHGDRKHRHSNRLKFLVKQLGWEKFAQLVHEELAKIRQAGVPPLPFDAEHPPELELAPTERAPAPALDELRQLVAAARYDEPRPPAAAPLRLPEADRAAPPATVPLRLPEAERTARFFRSNVRAQRQAGYSVVKVTLPLGDISGAHLRAVARLAEAYGDGTLRTTHGQDLLLRWVRNEDVARVHAALVAIDLSHSDADTLVDVTSCPGAESCKLAVTQSRGVAALLNEHFSAHATLLDQIGPLDVRVSGCPNGCGLHHVAGIGLQGGLRKVDGKPAPQYFVYLGGDPRPEVGRFGRLAVKIPARRVGEALERLAHLYVRDRQDKEDAAAFFARVPIPEVKVLLADLEDLTAQNATAEDFFDLGENHTFNPETSEGECAS